ncbi:hypothetical protein KAR34_05295 [bacterium]|nr:hypothetical protein [bacterium]
MKENSLLVIFMLVFLSTSFAATVDIYRSIGPSNTTALATGTLAGSLSISGNTATFASSQANNIGVGDALQYASSGGAIDAIAFIIARESAAGYQVQSAAGANPSSVGSTTTWNIYRAYTTLADAEAGTENIGIDVTVRDFDTGDRDIAANNERWHFVCYNGRSSDTSVVTVNGWTTSADHYIRIFTPYLSTEVGTSQRHTGSWSTSAYRLVVANAAALTLRADYTRVEGPQIRITAVSAVDARGIHVDAPGSAVDIRLSHNIIRGITNSSSDWHVGIGVWSAGTGEVRVWNNIIYDFAGTVDCVGIVVKYERPCA